MMEACTAGDHATTGTTWPPKPCPRNPLEAPHRPWEGSTRAPGPQREALEHARGTTRRHRRFVESPLPSMHGAESDRPHPALRRIQGVSCRRRLRQVARIVLGTWLASSHAWPRVRSS